jgi:hypothetical protein
VLIYHSNRNVSARSVHCLAVNKRTCVFEMNEFQYCLFWHILYVCMYVNSSPAMVIPPIVSIAFAHSVQEYLGQQNETRLQPSQSLICHKQHKQSSTEPLKLLRKRTM